MSLPSKFRLHSLFISDCLFRLGLRKTGIAFANHFLLPEHRYVMNIAYANYALMCGDEEGWLSFVNLFLRHFDLPPLSITGRGSIFCRFSVSGVAPCFDPRKISVILPVFNSEETIECAIRSILAQSWRNLELVVVDDASSDSTPSIISRLVQEDCRIKYLRNKVNVGPYVSKNIGLGVCTGTFVTGQDADDWSHPCRLERQVKRMDDSGDVRASVGYMLRIAPSGFFTHISRVSPFTFDGVTRKSLISFLCDRETLNKTLGYWDSVRFGADSEMLARAKAVLGDSFAEYRDIGMVCLSAKNSLTNDRRLGVSRLTGLSPVRREYMKSWQAWHQRYLTAESAYLPFLQTTRRYRADSEMIVDESIFEKLL